MSLIYVLLIVEIVLLCVSWFITDGDLSSASVVVIIVMMVSTIFNIYAIDLWDDSTFYLETVMAVSIALLGVILSEFLAILFIKNKKRRSINNEYNLIEINISNGKVYLVTILCIIMTLLYYLNIRSIGIRIGLNVGSAISLIKSNYQDTTMRLNVVVRQGYKFITAFAYISLLVFINNMLAKKNIKKNFIHLIPSVCLVIVSILSGGRVDIIRLLSAAFLFYIVLSKEKNGWSIRKQKKTTWYFVKVAVPLIFVVAIIMTQLRTITKGDITSNNLTNILDYVAYYIGGPLQVLNTKIHNGILNYRLEYWGELTFRGFWNFISKYGFTKEYIPLNLSSYEYLMVHLGIGGNTDTFVGPPLFDFGYLGMLIVVILEFGVICTCYYKKLYYTQNSYVRNKRLLIYGFCFFIVTMSYYENCMYTVLSQTGLISIIFLLVGYWFYFKAKIVIKH